jgi:hypothetical protein
VISVVVGVVSIFHLLFYNHRLQITQIEETTKVMITLLLPYFIETGSEKQIENCQVARLPQVCTFARTAPRISHRPSTMKEIYY